MEHRVSPPTPKSVSLKSMALGTGVVTRSVAHSACCRTCLSHHLSVIIKEGGTTVIWRDEILGLNVAGLAGAHGIPRRLMAGKTVGHFRIVPRSSDRGFAHAGMARFAERALILSRRGCRRNWAGPTPRGHEVPPMVEDEVGPTVASWNDQHRVGVANRTALHRSHVMAPAAALHGREIEVLRRCAVGDGCVAVGTLHPCVAQVQGMRESQLPLLRPVLQLRGVRWGPGRCPKDQPEERKRRQQHGVPAYLLWPA